MSSRLRRSAPAVCAVIVAACAVATPSSDFPLGRFKAWTPGDPAYRIFPGDRLDIAVPTAPELSGERVVGPDGRVALPLTGSVLVADKTLEEAETALAGALSSQLLDPRVEASISEFGSQRIFVGGEVATPGVYDLPSTEIGALEAVFLAGGFRDSARRREVVVLRRAPGGGAMLRVANLQAGLHDADGIDDQPLQRFDIVYVPRKTISEVNLFWQQYFRDALPISFSLFYDVGRTQ